MSDIPQAPFLVTKEYNRFAEFCDACRLYRYIGLCYGLPGIGKTWSARHYADWDRVEVLEQQMWDDNFRAIPAIVTCRSVFYTPIVAGTPYRLAKDLHYQCHQLSTLRLNTHLALDEEFDPKGTALEPELIIVDEANRLKMASLEQVRDIFDRKKIGLVLIGMPGLEKSLSRYPQLYSRIGFVHQFNPLGIEEMRFILSHLWQPLGLDFDHPTPSQTEAVAAIFRFTGGNFRLIQHLFAQIERILRINNLETITKEVVETARKNLLIGQSH
ncbi:MAG: AAA family ATPase [Aggregatilineales bacterium]